MSLYAEERALVCQYATRVHGCPTWRDAERLLELFAASVEVRYSRAASEGEYRPLPDDRGRIVVPTRLDDRAQAAAMLHELAHYVVRAPRTGLIAVGNMPRHLEQLWESEVQRFLDAWYLPATEVLRHPDDEDLAWVSGCDLRTIARRRRQVGRDGVLAVGDGPAWSARHSFQVIREEHPTCPQFRLLPRFPDLPPFQIKYRPDRLLQERAELHLHLLALRPEEFAHRYAPDASRPGVPDWMPVEELLALARGAGTAAGRRW